MSYIEQADLAGTIPPATLTKALDDNKDGTEDAGLWDAIVATITIKIDAWLAARYTLPLDPVPSLVREAARIFAAEMIYDRLGFSGTKNPWADRARDITATLEKVATGELSLGDTVLPSAAATSSGLVSEPARTYNTPGRMMV